MRLRPVATLMGAAQTNTEAPGLNACTADQAAISAGERDERCRRDDSESAPDAELVSPMFARMVARGHSDLRVVLGSSVRRSAQSALREFIGDGRTRVAVGDARILGLRVYDAKVIDRDDAGPHPATPPTSAGAAAYHGQDVEGRAQAQPLSGSFRPCGARSRRIAG